MPTVLREKGYRFFFYSKDCEEPPHVHVDLGHGGPTAKFWLQPIRRERSSGFSPHQLSEIEKTIEARLGLLLDGWAEHCD